MMNHETQTYYFPLLPKDFDELKQGQLVMKHFSPPLQPDKILFVVVWNKPKMGSLDKKLFDEMRRAGISVANVPLSEPNFSHLENGDAVEAKFPGFSVWVMTEKTWQKAQKEKELKHEQT